ncbi:MAG: hypothetical protein J6O49_09475 [Bacteroidaceae bacterium]|nr:hypothetical protein [Bacteroidaceae bacterium]
MSLLQDNQPVLNARPEQTVAGAAQDMYIINNLIANIHTMMPVKILSVTVPPDSLAPIGRCEVLPLVQQIDGSNNVYPMGKIINVPYLRVQGGDNAVVMDPKEGDVGLCGFCERDISIVKRTGELSAPDTRRKYDINSAVYMFTMMSGTPTQYIHFKSSGIDIKTTGDLNINGLIIKADGTLITKDGDTVDKHSHGGVQSGGSNTSPLGG